MLIAIIVFAGMIRFPQTEGRAANLDLVSIYKDPFIIYGFVISIPFYVGAYQVFKLLGHIGQQKTSSNASLRTIRNISRALLRIKYCALALIGGIVGGEAFLILFGPKEDIAGIIAMGIYTSVILSIITIGASVFEKRLKSLKGVSR